MVYSFIYEFDKVPVKERKKKMKDLTNEQLQVLWHVYFNKSMFDKIELRDYIEAYEPSKPVSFTELLEYLDTENEIDTSAKMILDFVYDLGLSYGDVEAGKATQIIFCKKRIVGIKMKDVKAEISNRKELLEKYKNI